ncbi:MAG: efflux RND transporter periplasmic adaptor subunit [Pirellulaceae bacterium]
MALVAGLISIVGSLASCGTRTASVEKQSDAPAELPSLTAELVAIQPRVWPTTVRAQGSLMADEVSVVGTKVPGRVATVHVDLGDRIQAGQSLVTLDQEEFRLRIDQVEAQLAQAYAVVGLQYGDDVAKLDRTKAPPAREAMAVWDKAKADLVRNRELFSSEAITEVELEQSVTAERVAEAQYASTLNSLSTSIAAIQVRTAELAMARQQLSDTVVPAPFDGMVQHRHVAPGTFVAVGQAMVTVVRTNRLRFRATLPERHVQRLTLGQQVRLHIESINKPRWARITRISPVVDELSRSLMFEADVDNGDGSIQSGLFAEAEVILDATTQSLAVEADSVVEFAGVEKVWKVVDGVTREQVVETGQRREGAIQILKGLSPGDVILRDSRAGRAARIAAASRVVAPEVQLSTVAGGEASGDKDAAAGPLLSTE